MKKNIILLILVLFSNSSFAKIFSNSYVSFEIPEDWNCAQEGPSWVCTPKLSKDAKEVIIVLNAKTAGPEDTVANFKAYLSTPRNITDKNGTPITSKVMAVEDRSIEGQAWVRAQHLSSEVSDFYTLYLVTVKSQLAILASFSVERSKAMQYNQIFDKAVRSLKIVASQQLLIPPVTVGKSSETIGIELDQNAANLEVPPAPSKGNTIKYLWIAALLLAVAGLAFYFKKSL